MATAGGIAAGLLGSAASEAAAFAAGLAIGPALAPEVEFLRNEAWSAVQTKALDAATAAEVAAENFASYGDMEKQAAFNGIAAPLFQYLYDVTLTAPGTGELLAMLRRGTISNGNFTHGLRKAKLEPMWDAPLANLQNVIIPGPDLAYMVVRGVVPDGGTLPSSLPTRADNLKLPPQLAIDTLLEASKTGWDAERFAGLVARSGLAMAPIMAAQANFRGILTDNDYRLTIARGDLFPAYAAPVLEVARQIPTVGEAIQYQLRGFTDRAGRLSLTDLHGMSHPHSDVLYDVAGRAPSDRQVYIGLARGAKYPASYADVPSPFREAIERSDIRPEFADIVYQNRYSLPSAFVVRTLLTDGAINAARGQSIYEHSGWPADLAQLVAEHYAAKATGGAVADPHVTKAENQLWTAQHASYVKDRSDDAFATTTLQELGVASGAIPAVLSLWKRERAIVKAGLSAAQIKKAYSEGTFTQPEAVARLVELQWSAADATVYLGE